jgi:hypothetical protein
MYKILRESGNIILTTWVHIREEGQYLRNGEINGIKGLIKTQIYNRLIENKPTSILDFSVDVLKKSDKTFLKLEIYPEKPIRKTSIIKSVFQDLMVKYPCIVFSHENKRENVNFNN